LKTSLLFQDSVNSLEGDSIRTNLLMWSKVVGNFMPTSGDFSAVAPDCEKMYPDCGLTDFAKFVTTY
jgi:hypothetical protein